MSVASHVVLIELRDYTCGRSGDKYVLQDVSMDKSVGDLKMQICQVIPGLTLDSCLLLLGDQILENSKKLTCYNKSGRSRLVVGIYDKALITINVFLTPHVGGPTCIWVPLWAKVIATKKMTIQIQDHEKVGVLKRQICQELDDPARFDPKSLRLVNGRNMLWSDEDDKVLGDVGIHDGSNLVLYTPLCWRKKRKGEPKTDVSVEAPRLAMHATFE